MKLYIVSDCMEDEYGETIIAICTSLRDATRVADNYIRKSTNNSDFANNDFTNGSVIKYERQDGPDPDDYLKCYIRYEEINSDELLWEIDSDGYLHPLTKSLQV